MTWIACWFGFPVTCGMVVWNILGSESHAEVYDNHGPYPQGLPSGLVMSTYLLNMAIQFVDLPVKNRDVK